MKVRFSSLGIANHENSFFVGIVYKSEYLVIKLKLDPLNPAAQQYRYFSNGIVQGQVLFDVHCAGYNYAMRGQEGLFFNILRVDGDVARGILKKIIEPNMAAVVVDCKASAPLCNLLLMSEIATPCTEADLRDITSTSSPSKSSIKRPADHQHSSQIKVFRLPDAPPVQIIPTDEFADALTIAATVFNKLIPSHVFFVYASEHGPDILEFENKTIMKIRHELSDLLWERQTGAWCGLHSLNFLRRPGDARYTPADMHDFQEVLKNENQVIGHLASLHQNMILPNGWITIDFMQAFMTRVMNLQQPSTFLPEVSIQVRGNHRKIRAMHNAILESSLSNSAVAMMVVADTHCYVFRKIKVNNEGEEKMYLAFLDSNYTSKK
jgi:hypothetical protein